MAIRMHPSIAVHPGEWLREEIVAANGIGIGVLAVHLDVSRQALSAVLNGRAHLSASMAIRFEKAFGVKADTLMRMQVAYDMAQARVLEDAITVVRLVAA